MKLYKSTVKLLRKRLGVPADYSIIFVSSATECWEIIAQSLITKNSFHFFNGAFGEKWYNYTRKLHPLAIGYRFGEDVEVTPENLDLSGTEAGVICITQNETSNGTQVHNEQIGAFREAFPEHLIAVDATSSMGGIFLDFSLADIWYASVQKCFGLPAGMGILIVSPAALKRAAEINEQNHYNSLMFMQANAVKFQTHYTPNVLGIYLLNQTQRKAKNIHKIHKQLEKRAGTLTSLIHARSGWELMIENDKVRSLTVFTIRGSSGAIKRLKQQAQKEGITLGNGYGPYAADTFRIANFPATDRSDWKKLKEFLKNNM